MTQEPSLPKLKIGEECLAQVAPLIILIDSIAGAENWLACAKEHPESASAKRTFAIKTIGEIKSVGVFDSEKLDEIAAELANAGKYEFTGYPLRALAPLRKAKMKAFEFLLNAAVDCECREAKAVEKQLGSEALQRVLGPGEEIDGRPRRWTEIPGKEETVTLSPGQVVMIYEDPVSKKKPEGKAKLLKLIRSEEKFEDMQFWEVEFEDGTRTERWVDIREM
jgi:hypothetical protein